MKLSFTFAPPSEVRAGAGGAGAEPCLFEAWRLGAAAFELGPEEPVDPGTDETVELFEPDPPHPASARPSTASKIVEARHMGRS